MRKILDITNSLNIPEEFVIPYGHDKAKIDMKYYQEMKYEDMSDILGTSVGGLKASYHHAVKKIENFLARFA